MCSLPVTWIRTAQACRTGDHEMKTPDQLRAAEEFFHTEIPLTRAMGIVEWHLRVLLSRFQQFIERRSYPTGGWRGCIHDGVVQPAA